MHFIVPICDPLLRFLLNKIFILYNYKLPNIPNGEFKMYRVELNNTHC